MSNWKNDINAESELKTFIMKNFKHCEISDKIKTVQLTDNSNDDFNGIDMKITNKNNEIFYVDIKAQLHYINKALPTFAFEIDYYKDSKYKKGWLYGDKLTQIYFLVWPCATHENNNNVKVEDFTKLFCMLILRKDLVNYLEEIGMNFDTFCKEREIFIQMNTTEKHIREKSKGKSDGIKLVLTKKLSEKPLNVVIGTDILEKIAFKKFVITKEKTYCEEFSRFKSTLKPR